MLAIFAFRSAWNDFLWPLIAVNKPEMFPLPVALALLRSTYSSESYGPIKRGAALSAAPLLIVFGRQPAHRGRRAPERPEGLGVQDLADAAGQSVRGEGLLHELPGELRDPAARAKRLAGIA